MNDREEWREKGQGYLCYQRDMMMMIYIYIYRERESQRQIVREDC